jgi:hypothetical protein
MTITGYARRPRWLLGLVLLVPALVACTGSATLPSVAPEDGVRIENATGSAVEIVYEHVDDELDRLTMLEPGAVVVVGAMFDGVDAPCVNGRLVALGADDAEVDELYFVCRGKTWVVGG